MSDPYNPSTPNPWERSTPNPWEKPTATSPDVPQISQSPQTPYPPRGSQPQKNPQLSIPHVYTQVYRILRDNPLNWLSLVASAFGALLITLLPFIYFAFADMFDLLFFGDAGLERVLNRYNTSPEMMMVRLVAGMFILYAAIDFFGSIFQSLLLKAELTEVGGVRADLKNVWHLDGTLKRGALGYLVLLVLVTVGSFLLVIPGLLAGIFLPFVPHFMADRGMGIKDAMRASFETVKAHLAEYILIMLPIGFGAVVVYLFLQTSGSLIVSFLLLFFILAPLLAVRSIATTYFYRRVTGGLVVDRD